MSIRFDLVKPGDLLYDVHRVKMGNTRMSRTGCWTVRVLDIDHENGLARVSWNGNTPTVYSRREIEQLRRSEPKEKK